MSRLLLAHSLILAAFAPFGMLATTGPALMTLAIGSLVAGVAHGAMTGLRPLPQFKWLAAAALMGATVLVQWAPMVVHAPEMPGHAVLGSLTVTVMSFAVVPTAFFGWPLARGCFGLGCRLAAREDERPGSLEDVFS